MQRVQDTVWRAQEDSVCLSAYFEPDHEHLVQIASWALLLLGVVVAHQRDKERVELHCQITKLTVVHEFVGEVVVEELVLVEFVRLSFLKVAPPPAIQKCRVNRPVLSSKKHSAYVVAVLAEGQSVCLTADQVSEFEFLPAYEVGVGCRSPLVDSQLDVIVKVHSVEVYTLLQLRLRQPVRDHFSVLSHCFLESEDQIRGLHQVGVLSGSCWHEQVHLRAPIDSESDLTLGHLGEGVSKTVVVASDVTLVEGKSRRLFGLSFEFHTANQGGGALTDDLFR